jgi:L-methionine (R)-S-oxide reductase
VLHPLPTREIHVRLSNALLAFRIVGFGARIMISRNAQTTWIRVPGFRANWSRMNASQSKLIQEFTAYAKSAPSVENLMKHIADELHEKMTRYNWVGFYVLDPTDSNYLIVGPFAGSFTPNARIPLGKGLCGAAAATGKVVVVDDVTKDPRYLPGSSMVKSEVVVPIFANKKVVAELDAESYFANTYNPAECKFVEACAEVVANRMNSK